MSTVALSPEGVERAKKGVIKASQSEIGGKNMTDLDLQLNAIKELAKTNPGDALNKVTELKKNYSDAGRLKDAIITASEFVGGLVLIGASPVLGTALLAKGVYDGIKSLTKRVNNEDKIDAVFKPLLWEKFGRISREEMLEKFLGKAVKNEAPTKTEKQSKPENDVRKILAKNGCLTGKGSRS